MAKSYAILGIGRFGKTLARTLYEAGMDVMVVDGDEEVIEQCSQFATYAIVADLANEAEIRQIGLENFDVVVVGMATDIEASIVCIMLAKEAGVKEVVAKVSSKRMGDVLRRIGADDVIFPEEEAGVRTAQALLSPDLLEYYDISEDMCMIKMKPLAEWIGKTVRQLDLKKNYHLSIAAVEADGRFNHLVDPDMVLQEETVLLVLCGKEDIYKFI